MEYQEITIKLPRISDEAAVYLQDFIYAIIDAIDETYCYQIKKYYNNLSEDNSVKYINLNSELDDPPF